MAVVAWRHDAGAKKGRELRGRPCGPREVRSRDSRGELYASPRPNAYLTESVRAAMVAQDVDHFVIEKQGQMRGQTGSWGDSEDRSNKYDS